MKLSIAIATYNGALYIDAQLESILAQTRRPDEVVVSDDGSSDSTLEVLRRFRETAPFPVTLIENQRRVGVSGNFNRALEGTTGELIFLSDQDDWWFPEKLKVMESIASDDEDGYVFMCDAELADRDLHRVNLTKLGQIRSSGLPESMFVMGCCIAVRRELLDLAMPIPWKHISHDKWIVEMAECMHGKRVHDQVLQLYRRHGLNDSKFIANRLSKVNWGHVALRRIATIWRLIRHGSADYHAERMRHKLLILQRIEVASNLWHGERRRWVTYAEEVRRQLEALRERRRILYRPRSCRVIRVVSLWVQGRYARDDGVSGAVVDMVSARRRPKRRSTGT